LILFIAFCCTACRAYSPEEAKEIYLNNSDVFQQVADICVKYPVSYPINDWKPNYDASLDGTLNKKKLTKQEKNALKKCGKFGCYTVFSNINSNKKSLYVNFVISHSVDDQGVVVFLGYVNDLWRNSEKVTLEEFILKMNYGKYVETEELSENTYYYRVWGDPHVLDSSTDTLKLV